MLKGQLTLKESDGSLNIVNIRGYDINGVYDLEVTPTTEEVVNKLDFGYTLSDGQFKEPIWGTASGCHIRVALSKISVAKYQVTDYTAHIDYPEKGIALLNDLDKQELKELPKLTNEINKDYWYIIGSLIRGIRSACVPINRSDYNELSSNVNDVNSNIEYTINVAGAQGTSGKGTATLRNSQTNNVDFTGTFQGYEVSLNLYDDGSSSYVLPFTSTFHHIVVDAGWALPQQITNVSLSDDESFYTVDQIIDMNKGVKSYEWLRDRNYIIVDQSNFKEAVTTIYRHGKSGELIAFDTETTGLFISNQSRQGEGDSLVGMVFSIEEGTAYYFPVAHTEFENIGTESQIPYLMEKYFAPILERCRILTHNGSFDWKVMHIYGINTNIVADTRIAAFLTVSHLSNNKQMSTGLKSLTQEYLHRDSLELSDFVANGWGSSDLTFANLPKESVRYYACADTDNTLGLWNFFEREGIIDMFGARKELEIECLFTRAIGYSEFYGMYANPDSVHELGEQLEAELADLRERIYRYAGEQFNIGSAKQKSDILFRKMGIPVIKETSSGNPSTDKGSLKALLKRLEPDSDAYKLIEALLEYANVNVLYQNFVSKYDIINPKIGRPNFVKGYSYSGVTQFLETGRVSINNPNYQSFNDSVKKYISPRDGYYTCDFDYSAIEYRVLVSVAGEADLVAKFSDPDYDYHRSMASMLHGVPYDEVTPQLRSQSKGLNFGIPYGMSVPSLAQTMGVDVQTAQVLYDKYFEVQPKVRKFFEEQKAFAVANSYNTTYFGRRRTYDRRKDKVSSIRRKAGNHPIQGTAADIYKLGIGRLFLKIMEKGYMGKVLLTAFVHDEAVIECHNTINPAELLSMVQEALMIKVDGWCPLYIGCGFGTSWYDAKKIELPVQVQNSIVAKGELEWWDGDRDKLRPWAESEIFNFKVNYLKDYLVKEENWGKPLDSVSFGHLSELLAMVSGNTAKVDDTALTSKGIGIAYTPEMANYKYERKSVLDNLAEFGELFGCSELVEGANIQEKEVTEVSSKPTKVRPEDIQFDEEDPVDLAVSSAMLSGSSLNSTDNQLFTVHYHTQGTAESLPFNYQVWNSDMVGMVKSAKEGDYQVIIVQVAVGEDGKVDESVPVVLKPSRFSVSPLLASQLIARFSRL